MNTHLYKLSSRTICLMGLAAALPTAVCPTASAQHSDIEMEVADGLRVEPQLVEAAFGEGLLPAYRLNEPGFEAEDGALAAGDVVSVRLPALNIGTESRSLWFWDGQGSPSFAASPHQLQVTNPAAAQSVLVNGVDPSDVLGLGIADDEGGLHQDLLFDLVDDTAAVVADPTAGVYLWGMTLSVPDAGDSAPIYWLAGAGVDEALIDEAVAYAAVEFGIIPEPTSLMLLLLGGAAAGLAACRRRKTPA